MCIIGGRQEHFTDDPDLSARAQKVLATWPRSTRAVLAHADPAAFFHVEMWTSVPFALGAPARVTLLGDAIHAMTPTLGRGANMALRDASMLADAIAASPDIPTALATYEERMVPSGFAIVREAATMGTRLMGQRPLP